MYHRIFRQSEVRRESNHYNSNCLLCQRCWLLCTTYGECKAPRTCEDNVGHSQDFFYSTHRRAMSANNIVLQNIIHYCTCKPTFPYVMHTVHGWKQCGPFMALQCYEWTSCKFNKIFFFRTVVEEVHSQIWFPNRKHSKVFRAIFVLCLYATHSFIFANNAKLVLRRKLYCKCTVGRTEFLSVKADGT